MMMTMMICLCIGHTVSPAKMAEPIDMLLGGRLGLPRESCITLCFKKSDDTLIFKK